MRPSPARTSTLTRLCPAAIPIQHQPIRPSPTDPGLCNAAFNFFKCQEICERDGCTWWLVADYSVECYAGAWQKHLPLAIVSIALYAFGIPACTLLVLRKHRDAYFNVGPPPKPPNDHSTIMARYGALYDGFEYQYYYTGMLEHGRKLILAGGMVFFTHFSATQACFAGCRARAGCRACTGRIFVCWLCAYAGCMRWLAGCVRALLHA